MLWDILERRPLKHGFKPIERLYINWQAITLGDQDPRVAPSLSQEELLSAKPHPKLICLS